MTEPPVAQSRDRRPGWDPQPTRTRQVAPLTSGRVVGAAIEEADAHGLASLTIRGIASSLGSSPMAIYRHVASRDALVALMADRALGEPPHADEPERDWQQCVRVWTSELLKRYEAHPWLTDAVFTSLLPTANRARWIEASLAGMNRSALTLAQRLDATLLLDGHARNIAVLNRAIARQPSSGAFDPGLLEFMPAAEYPNLRTVIESGALVQEGAQDGTFGLETVLAGLRRLDQEASERELLGPGSLR